VAGSDERPDLPESLPSLGSRQQMSATDAATGLADEAGAAKT